MKTLLHDIAVRAAEDKGYRVTDSSCGSTTLIKKSRTGGIELVHICHTTGASLGANTLGSAQCDDGYPDGCDEKRDCPNFD